MLSDRELGATEAFGLGTQLIHSSRMSEVALEALPVLTTLAVDDKEGKILFMKQAENYQCHSAREVVSAVMQAGIPLPTAGWASPFC